MWHSAAQTVCYPLLPNPRPPCSYEILVLALQWPAARIGSDLQLAAEYGAALAAGQVAPGWTIHGFWPTHGRRPTGPGSPDPASSLQAGSDGGPSHCGKAAAAGIRSTATSGSGHSLQAQPATPGAALVPPCLVPALAYFWPDITAGQPSVGGSGGSTQLWWHEWETHGICYGSIRDSSGTGGSSADGSSSSSGRSSGSSDGSSRQYFLDALLLAARSNLSDVLASAGIVPSATRPYRGLTGSERRGQGKVGGAGGW